MNTSRIFEMLDDEELKTIAGGEGTDPGATTYIQQIPASDGWKDPY
jgi:hypothetical protein